MCDFRKVFFENGGLWKAQDGKVGSFGAVQAEKVGSFGAHMPRNGGLYRGTYPRTGLIWEYPPGICMLIFQQLFQLRFPLSFSFLCSMGVGNSAVERKTHMTHANQVKNNSLFRPAHPAPLMNDYRLHK